MKKVYFMGRWIPLNKLVSSLKKLGFEEGVNFAESELEYKGFPRKSTPFKVESKSGGK